MKNLKKSVLAICILSIFFSCSNSYEKIPREKLVQNEDLVLNSVYNLFFKTKEYINGSKMSPPMQFDAVYIFIVNLNDKDYDFKSLEDDGYKVTWDDLTINVNDLRLMCENNIPIVQMSFHWVDPMSESGNNKWVNRTYFFPECKFENNTLNLGKPYYTEGLIRIFKYFPYFYNNVENNPFIHTNWIDLKGKEKAKKINYNGSIYTVSALPN